MDILGNLRRSTKFLVAWNTLSQLIGKLFTAGITFLVSILIARAYGAQGYGDFTKITTYVAFFYLIADFGLNAIYLQRTHESVTRSNPGQSQTTTSDTLWQSLFGLRLIASLLLVFLSLAILSFFPQGTGQGYTGYVRLGIVLFTPTIFFQALLTSANASFQKHLRYDLSTVAVASGSLVSLSLVWLFTQSSTMTSGILLSIMALVAASVLTAGAALLLVKRLGQLLIPLFSLRSMAKLLAGAMPLGVTLLFNLIYFRIDAFILTLTRATTEVGVYGFAYKVFELPLAIPTFFMNSMYPLLLRTKNGEPRADNTKFLSLLRKSFWFLLLSSLSIVAITWLTAPLFTYVRGDFAPSTSALRVLSLGLPFFFLSSFTMWTLISLKKQKAIALIYGSSMAINILLNVRFIPTNGYMAAAWITVGSEGMVLLASSLYLHIVLNSVATPLRESIDDKSAYGQINEEYKNDPII